MWTRWTCDWNKLTIFLLETSSIFTTQHLPGSRYSMRRSGSSTSPRRWSFSRKREKQKSGWIPTSAKITLITSLKYPISTPTKFKGRSRKCWRLSSTLLKKILTHTPWEVCSTLGNTYSKRASSKDSLSIEPSTNFIFTVMSFISPLGNTWSRSMSFITMETVTYIIAKLKRAKYTESTFTKIMTVSETVGTQGRILSNNLSVGSLHSRQVGLVGIVSTVTLSQGNC